MDKTSPHWTDNIVSWNGVGLAGREIFTFSLYNTSIMFELLQEVCIIFVLFSILPQVYKLTSENNNNFLQFYSLREEGKQIAYVTVPMLPESK